MTSGCLSYEPCEPWASEPPHPATVLGYGSAVFLGRYRDQSPDPLWPGAIRVRLAVHRWFGCPDGEPREISVRCSSFDLPEEAKALLIATGASQGDQRIWQLAWAFEGADTLPYLETFEAALTGKVKRGLKILVNCHGVPVPDATVTVRLRDYGRRPRFRRTALTDSVGRVEFIGLPEGLFAMSVQQPVLTARRTDWAMTMLLWTDFEAPKTAN